MWRYFCLLMCVASLCSCAVQPMDDVELSSAEMKSAGAASINSHENVPKLYENAQYIQHKRT